MPNGHPSEFPWPWAYNREALETAVRKADIWDDATIRAATTRQLEDLIVEKKLVEASTLWTVVALYTDNDQSLVEHAQGPTAEVAAKKVKDSFEEELRILAVFRGAHMDASTSWTEER